MMSVVADRTTIVEMSLKYCKEVFVIDVRLVVSVHAFSSPFEYDYLNNSHSKCEEKIDGL